MWRPPLDPSKRSEGVPGFETISPTLFGVFGGPDDAILTAGIAWFCIVMWKLCPYLSFSDGVAWQQLSSERFRRDCGQAVPVDRPAFSEHFIFHSVRSPHLNLPSRILADTHFVTQTGVDRHAEAA